MKLFWKIFTLIFISFIIVVFLISYVITANQISDAEEHIIEENKIIASFLSKELEVGYLQSRWPFESLKKLSERKDFLFWWVVKDNGIIYLADDASFTKTYTYEYFPQLEITEDEYLFLNHKQNYGIFIKSIKIGREEWTFWLGFSLEEVSEIIKTISMSIFGLSILAIVALGTLLYFVIIYFTKPLYKLVDGTKAIARGNLNYVLKIKSKDEIGQLASAFNHMAADLKKSQVELRKYTLGLEKEVKKRTNELSKKIEELNKTKTAILNIMEDTEQTNVDLSATQKDLKKSLKDLETTDMKKDEFISVAAHELKTPLTSIRGFAQLLQDEEIIKNPEKRKKYFGIIVKDTGRLGRLITDILDLSRVDLGTLKLNIKDVKIKDFLKDLREQMDIIIRQKGIAPVYEVEENLPYISVDQNRLMQVLSNLINNAVNYTDKGGKITIKIYRRENHMFFSVTDTGRGIPKEHLHKIFERFYQVDSSHTRKVGGTGLGLAICKELVESMDGTIVVASTVGKGTTFIFNIPIKKNFAVSK
jgi:signal transduction histidine kinase